jgi:hypothetical protein
VTGADFSGVDIDLLADFVGGALDGTPDEAAVARRIAEDPAWQDAFVELSSSVETVSGALRAWGSEPEPMPADVVARLDAALLAPGHADSDPQLSSAPQPSFPPRPGSAPQSSSPSQPSSPSQLGSAPHHLESPVPHLVAVPDEGSPRTRTRRLKWAAPIGVAAAALAFLGFGVRQMGSSDSADEDSSAAGSAPEAATLAALPAQIDSGMDYTRQTLGQVAAQTFTGSSSSQARINGQDRAGETANGKVMPSEALSRLRAPEALVACLTAIASENGSGPITAQTVDYARFQGLPAVVVHFTATNGTWVWAVGADCGSPGSGADPQASVRVS